jgi:hypothetical protein
MSLHVYRVTGTNEKGETVDVTAIAQSTIDARDIARISGGDVREIGTALANAEPGIT